ncbi:MAG TPA: ketopantoate reductase C-terminal domain-containing protein [Methanoregulaceae archaeon]|nr:MAG: hypothetical protein IPI71_01360 [Methanolinea sp.]HON80822.1 ketopantoate reductase C-terminal domain-containing protein [Methanoregulaceae archaeon]HPD09557.1 ketopantoate reductase C-terminal domain-containing protein [Methanoregulaceae archaeon]HRT15228.1 ketopantoate reductase C-terminal domain-containing protein [Methanoregulaceae archaeon]HRU30799.1 ketopantoate reductase C-terminal domain-containing protein [Methanoregulaceae archaeon]
MTPGRFPTGQDASATPLVWLVRETWIPVGESSDIRSGLRAKTRSNTALNPVRKLVGGAYSALLAPHSWGIIRCITREAFAVAIAEIALLPWKNAEEYLSFLRSVQIPATADNRSSILQELSRGRVTGIGFLKGTVVGRGALHGILTSCSKCITNLARSREELA